MNELNFNTEENLINPSSGKSLGQIFNVEIRQNVDDESLRYVPSKSDDSKSSTNLQIDPVPWQTQLAKIVSGFKNGDSVGRVAVAILSNMNNAFRIIVYKTKKNLLATLTIPETTDISTIHRQNCYWQFYDDSGVYWSLLFERVNDEADFIEKLQQCGISIQLEIDYNLEHKKLNKDISKRMEITKKVEAKLSKTKEVSKKEENTVDSEIETYQEQKKLVKKKSFQRSKLLNRLSKIGAQQLPKLASQEQIKKAIDISDSETDTIECISITTSNNEPQSTDDTLSNFYTTSQYMLPSTGTSSGTVIGPLETQVMQMMLVENRTQNSEIRTNLDKLEMKIEKVLNKMDVFDNSTDKEDEILKLEEKILELKRENRKLKKERKNSGSGDQLEIEKITRLYGNELILLGINIDCNEKLNIETLIGELIDKSCGLESDLNKKNNQIQSIMETLKDMKQKYQEEVKSHSEAQIKLDEKEKKIESLEISVEKDAADKKLLNEKLSELKLQHAAQLHSVKLEMTETVKDIMNMLYHNLAETIVSMDKLVPEKVLALIGKTIRHDTLCAVGKISK